MFASMHQLHQHVQFNTQVQQATPLPAGSSNGNGITATNDTTSGSLANGSGSSSSSSTTQWQVQSVRLGPDGQAEQQLQQQVSCNAAWMKPSVWCTPSNMFDECAFDCFRSSSTCSDNLQ
jgi:hypothetical protein